MRAVEAELRRQAAVANVKRLLAWL